LGVPRVRLKLALELRAPVDVLAASASRPERGRSYVRIVVVMSVGEGWRVLMKKRVRSRSEVNIRATMGSHLQRAAIVSIMRKLLLYGARR
jgi:hypothetical protein